MPSHPICNRALLALCGLSIFTVGCAHRSVQAAAPVSAPPAPLLSEAQRPMTLAPDTDASPPPEIVPVAPSVAAQEPFAPPLAIPGTQVAPAPRKPQEPAVESAAETPSRPAAPLITPQLSPGRSSQFPARDRRGRDCGREKSADRAGKAAQRQPAGSCRQGSQFPLASSRRQQNWRLGPRAKFGPQSTASLHRTHQYLIAAIACAPRFLSSGDRSLATPSRATAFGCLPICCNIGSWKHLTLPSSAVA